MTPLDLIQTIARSVEVGHSGRTRQIRMSEMIARCRDVCDQHGLSYSPSDLKPERTDAPTSPGITRAIVTSVINSTVTRHGPNKRSSSRSSGMAGVQSRHAGSGQAKTKS